MVVVVALASAATALCPGFGTPSAAHPPVPGMHQLDNFDAPASGFAEALAAVDFDQVRTDLKDLFTSSVDAWPSDYGNYAPLFVRLAWHNSGSYRTSDGRGGVEGARQRFEPERSWADNTNLDKARSLLWPVKKKYGLGLSWGDLIVLAGNTAIESMGGPVLGFCAGRVDDADGSASAELGPSPEQELREPCPVNGECETPLGSTTIGLIYLNPEGPMAKPLPEKSALEVRDTFGRMSMNDTETVALIGGGHAFGKTHGACPSGAGPSPKEAPENPWPGLCGTGKGKDAFTSGFEGPWTTNPTRWDNSYFKNLVDFEWEAHKGPGGHFQWRVKGATPPLAPGPAGGQQEIMMLTSDISLTKDPQGVYQKIVQTFASDLSAFEHAFAHAWYKLTTRDMGPVTRCFGKDTAPPQPFQNPLPPPPPPAQLANFSDVRSDLVAMLQTSAPRLSAEDEQANSTYGPLMVRLAWQCASTFRQTDHLGGCNGARLRLEPEKSWPANAYLDQALTLLKPLKMKYGEGLSWADLIVLAGNTAIEQAGHMTLSFCGGRTDASEGSGSRFLAPRVDGSTKSADELRSAAALMGLSLREYVALVGGGHSLGSKHVHRSGFVGAWTSAPTLLSNDYFDTLLSETWVSYTAEGGKPQYKALGKELYMLPSDLLLKYDPEMLAIAQEFASDEDVLKRQFASAWTKLMNADRFASSTANLCDH